MTSVIVPKEAEAVQPRRLIPDRVFREWLGGISRTTLWRLEQEDPDFPKLVKIRHQNFREEAEARAYVERLIARQRG